MRYGKFLPENGAIGFLAPSFGCATEPYISLFDSALKQFEARGFKTVLGPNCRLGLSIGRSNRADLCAAELEESLRSEESDVLISCGGGELMCEILPFADWEALKEAPAKWYLGYSDNTNFTMLAATLLDSASIYGPCASSFGQRPWHPALEDALALLQGKKLSFTGYPLFEIQSQKDEEHPLLPYNVTEKTSYRCFVPTKAPDPSVLIARDADACLEETDSLHLKGRLLGGCIDCLENLVGTRFDKVEAFAEKYREDGVLWFLEACDLNPMTLRRSLWHMRMAGWFKHVSGFLIGRPLHLGEELLGLDMAGAVTGVLGDLGVPILFDADFGHLPPALPIVTGALGDVTATRDTLSITYRLA